MTDFRLTARACAALVFTFAVAASMPSAADDHGGKPQAFEYAVASDLRQALCSMWRAPVRVWSRLASLGTCCSPMIMASWRQATSVPTRNTLVGVTFVDNQTGYAVGHAATILKTVDGGENWTLQYNERLGETPLFAVYFADAQNGIAVGGFSYTFETDNGGESWTQRSLVEDSYDDFHLNDVFADKKGNLYIPAEFGTVYKSRDRGQSWQAIETGYDGSFWGGLSLANGDVLVFGMRGNVWRSSNAGKRWKKVTTGTDQSVSGGAQLDDGRVVLAVVSTVCPQEKSFTNNKALIFDVFITTGKSRRNHLGALSIKPHNLLNKLAATGSL